MQCLWLLSLTRPTQRMSHNYLKNIFFDSKIQSTPLDSLTQDRSKSNNMISCHAPTNTTHILILERHHNLLHAVRTSQQTQLDSCRVCCVQVSKSFVSQTMACWLSLWIEPPLATTSICEMIGARRLTHHLIQSTSPFEFLSSQIQLSRKQERYVQHSPE